MPTYQYACTACDHRFEAVQRFSDASLTECPTCTGLLRKVFNSVGIVFKGSGFYRTDSRAGSTVGAKSDGDSGSSKPEKGTSDKGSGDKASGGKGSSTGNGASGGSSGSSASSSGSSAPKAAVAAS